MGYNNPSQLKDLLKMVEDRDFKEEEKTIPTLSR